MASDLPIARADSIASISSDDAASSLSVPIGGADASFLSGSASTMGSVSGTVGGDGEKRTRKRFTELQQTMLENMFHRSSHPTREEREALASNFGMYVLLASLIILRVPCGKGGYTSVLGAFFPVLPRYVYRSCS